MPAFSLYPEFQNCGIIQWEGGAAGEWDGEHGSTQSGNWEIRKNKSYIFIAGFEI